MSLINSSLIPTSRIAAVEMALLQAFGTSAVTDISLLAGGLSASSVYKIVVHNKPYVLKLNAHATATLPKPLVLAAAAGIAPPLHYQDIENGISISGFIDSKPIRAVLAPDKLIAELAGTLKAIHSVPCEVEGDDLQGTIDGMIDRFRQTNMLSGPVFDECFGHYEKIRDKYPWKDTNKVFSHNDLNPSNILYDGERIWIIDWDVAFLNDQYIDLANVANFFVHTGEQESILLNKYFDNAADDYKTARFFVMRQVCRIIYAMLMFQVAVQSKPADYIHNQEMEGIGLKEFGALMGSGQLSLAAYEGQLMYGKALLNEAVHQMRSPRFAISLAQLV
ncbi:phosphotransferase [Chitinophaga oryziterrae]|uniref:Phosphotransferase n=1 Tax=Chitinophaga oryziterrae TaxID=1031224 RepID=A0A6N8J5E1_9BACT|nr:phosphotransferase [Chitinophaga oryziterrae]MVT40144.1 phosphotransferase [Chitinophaga oryziterrae]